MIVKMSKYAFMVYHKEYDTFLAQLRELGVVHVKENKSILDNAELQDILALRKRINLLMRYLKNLNGQSKIQLAPARELDKKAGLKLLQKIEELHDKKVQLQSVKASLEKDIAYMEIWGDFSWANFNRLKEARSPGTIATGEEFPKATSIFPLTIVTAVIESLP